MIDRYLIRYFLAVVDQGNFSRAAAQCNVAQPTLSVGIAKLERAVERPLFTRSNQRVELTEAGARFLAHARRIEQEFNSALGAMRATADAETIRLGVLSSIPGAAIAAACRAARGELPGALELVFGTERELAGLLDRGRIDAALSIVRPDKSGLLREAVLDEGYGVAMAGDHRLATREIVSAEELRDEVMIVRRHCELLSETSRHFVERAVRPHFALRSTNDERVAQMVAAGVGVTVMPDSYRGAEGIALVPMSNFPHRRTLGFLARERHFLDHGLMLAISRSLAS
ncbi:LysR family transcriptional regulator [Novosphingobium sp.]|uniref:LysR family transcriptional regulator n=1 Tax=Novosphingobium sp. TaxID=1874826 RepID=UPI002FDDA2CA